MDKFEKILGQTTGDSVGNVRGFGAMAQHVCMYMYLANISTLNLSPLPVQSYQGAECDAHGTSCWPMLLGHPTNPNNRQR
jgi:hypothetical protein